jgi:CTP:molybdopterin cytidylyltransferase MocA
VSLVADSKGRVLLPAIVLAGDRAGGNALARAHGLLASVLVDVAGRTCLERVLTSLRASTSVDGGLLVGPAIEIVRDNALLAQLLQGDDFRWHAPQGGPSASAASAATTLARYPALLTAGDHALLRPSTIDAFCDAAMQTTQDFVVGLVRYDLVRAHFPHSRRTLLKFADGHYCGSNLFLLRTANALAALSFWQQLESERKRPWRIAARLGPGSLLRYLSGSLTIASAFELLSKRAGCRVGYVEVDDPRAAVDVDSDADRILAEQLLRNE